MTRGGPRWCGFAFLPRRPRAGILGTRCCGPPQARVPFLRTAQLSKLDPISVQVNSDTFAAVNTVFTRHAAYARHTALRRWSRSRRATGVTRGPASRCSMRATIAAPQSRLCGDHIPLGRRPHPSGRATRSPPSPALARPGGQIVGAADLRSRAVNRPRPRPGRVTPLGRGGCTRPTIRVARRMYANLWHASASPAPTATPIQRATSCSFREGLVGAGLREPHTHAIPHRCR